MIINIGSLNHDHVYRVNAIATPGQTVSSNKHDSFFGGKGLNQSIALARAGATVRHVGCVGDDGADLLVTLSAEYIDCSHVAQIHGLCGHAVIQVADSGENAIVVYPGANHYLNETQLQQALADVSKDDWVLLQNECNARDTIFSLCAGRCHLAYNPAPMLPDTTKLPLEQLALLVVNLDEGKSLSTHDEPSAILSALAQRCPTSTIVLTLGSQGLLATSPDREVIELPARPSNSVDTTAAGDCFVGSLVACLEAGQPLTKALEYANQAAAISVSRPGAAPSIPTHNEVNEALSAPQPSVPS